VMPAASRDSHSGPIRIVIPRLFFSSITTPVRQVPD
jgi:hypothetical protein